MYRVIAIGLLIFIAIPAGAQVVIKDDPQDVSISFNEIWEALQIMERRLSDEDCKTVRSIWDPCINDPLCMARREVTRLELKQKEDEKLRNLIKRFRIFMEFPK